MNKAFFIITFLFTLSTSAFAAEFGHKGGPPPSNLDEFFENLRTAPYKLELLISFGTSKGGSAGHLALAIRDKAEQGRDDLVYSANFYADRAPEHEEGFFIDDLMCRIPKKEYLYGTTSVLGEDASFGLDMGECYKRAVIGIRFYGVPLADMQKLAAYCERINDDFHHNRRDTEYHKGPIVYDYMNLNCAKTIGSAFKFGLDWKDLKLRGEGLSGLHLIHALKANLPTPTALKIMAIAHELGWGMDVVLYKKYEFSTYVNPHDEGDVQYKDLPNRFPSVLSMDYRQDAGAYEDFDNLYAMHMLYNLGKHSIVLSKDRKLGFEQSREPLDYLRAHTLATLMARREKKNFLLRIFRIWGVKLFGKDTDNTYMYGMPEGRDAIDYQGLPFH